MPVALDPNETFRYVICTDRTKPIGEQPVLIFHFPTARQHREIARLFDQSLEAKSIEENFELRLKAVREILVGWDNFFTRDGVVIPYLPNNLDAVLSDNDLTELHSALLRDLSASEIDKKKFALSARSNSRGFVPSAAGGNATHPPLTSPSSSNALTATAVSATTATPVEAAENID